MTNGHKIISKPEILMMLEKHSNGDHSSKKISIIKWKWFTQNHSTLRREGGDIHKQRASFPLGLTLGLCEEPPHPVITWTVPYKQSSTDLQRATWLTDGSSKVNGQHSIERPPFSSKKVEEGKNFPPTLLSFYWLL